MSISEKPIDQGSKIPTPAHLDRVYHLLIEAYGKPVNEPDYDPVGGLIATILSQHTSDINSGRAYRQLIETFPSWEEVRDAQTYKVAEAIRCGGLANIKAVRIQDVLHTLEEQQQERGEQGPLVDSLNILRQMEPEEGWHYLRKLPGVGPKTAACVEMFHLDEAVMPVDTHVHRVSRRLGIIGPKVSADKAHEIYMQIAPPDWVYPLHVNMIRHGRKICHSQKPKCNICPLYSECEYAGGTDPVPMDDEQSPD